MRIFLNLNGEALEDKPYAENDMQLRIYISVLVIYFVGFSRKY